MVLSNTRKFEAGFPSRVISIVAEKFSSGKGSIHSTSESKRERGRRMVAEELKLSRVDVKERQQKFENMSQSKDPKVHYANRSQSVENPATKLIASLRKTRPVSAEPAFRSKVFKQPDKFGATSNGTNRAGSVKKYNDLKGYKNSINVGKVADKFERNSDLSQSKGGVSLANEQIRKSLNHMDLGHQVKDSAPNEVKNGPNIVPKGPRSSVSPIVEDRIRKLERGESVIKSKWTTGKGKPDLQKSPVDEHIKLSKTMFQNHGPDENSNYEQEKNADNKGIVMEEVLEERKLVKYNEANDVEKDFEITKLSNGRSITDYEDGKKMKEDVRGKSEMNDFIENEGRNIKETKEEDVRKNQYGMGINEDEKEKHFKSVGNELATIDDISLTANKQIWSGTEEGKASTNVERSVSTNEDTESRSSEQPLSNTLERTPSMKILVSSRAPKSPSTRRSTAIVRVNSKSSDKGDARPQVVRQNERASQELAHDSTDVNSEPSVNLSETTQGSNQTYENGRFEDHMPKYRGESTGSVFEDESGYYKNIRSDLRGPRGLSPEKQRLLSELLSIENKELAKSMGLSDELIELLREEEGFWKRQVELKRWRESHENRGRDDFGKKNFDPDKEKKIAELRKQHNSRQNQKSSGEDGLTIEELRLAEERQLAQEISELRRMNGKEEGERQLAASIVNNRTSMSPRNKTIYLKQGSVGNGVATFNSNLVRRDARRSYPQPMLADPFISNDSSGLMTARPNIRINDRFPRSTQPVPIENARAPSLNIVTNGPITYFEHIANVQRKSLVAEPYASHPRRKSVESPNLAEPPPARNDGSPRFGSRDSILDYSRDILHPDGDADRITSDSKVASQSYFAKNGGHFGVDAEGDSELKYSMGSMPEYDPTGQRNAFTDLKKQNHFTDASYLPFINNDNNNNNNNNNKHNEDPYSNISEQLPRSQIANNGEDIHQDETRIERDHNQEAMINHQPHFGEGVDGSTRTYHVTSVAVRYARAGLLNRGGLSNKERLSQSSHSIEEPMLRQQVNGSRAFSESNLMISNNYNDYKSMSDGNIDKERLGEALLVVAKNTSKTRCSSCRRLISERAVMTVADSGMFWHTTCFYCVVCGIMLVKTKRGSTTQVRLIDDELHCLTCFSQDGGQLSEV